jgi:hypothetical protein
MNDLRAEFERVLAEQQRLGFVSYYQCETWNEKHQCYRDDEVDNMYRMFIASRAALKVELPDCNNESHDCYRALVEDELDRAGISYEYSTE